MSEATRLRSSESIKTTMVRILLSPSVMFLFLALAIMGPLLGRGHILALDSPLALNWDTSGYFWGISDGPESVFAATYNSAPIALVLKVIGLLLPLWVVEKLWLVLLLWLCGVGASRLPYLRGQARYYAGMLYTINPFTYIRFVSGQWGVLGAYALMPFAVNSFIRLLEEPRPRHAVKTVLFLSLIGLLQLQGLILALLALFLLYVGRITVVRGAFQRSLPMVLLSAALFLGVNLFWIIRYALAGGGVLTSMPIGQLDYFAASPAVNVVSLRGFWLSGPYMDVSNLGAMWWLALFCVLFLAINCVSAMLRVSPLRWLVLGLVLTGLVGVVLAVGPNVSMVRPVFNWLWEHFPPYRAFRDSYKFVALLALAYTYLGAFGLQSILESLSQSVLRAKRLLPVAGCLALLVPAVYGLPIFGAWGQLHPTEFPADWQEVRAMLDADSSDYNVLVLPWHMYMDFSWLPNRWKRLANPAPALFSQPTISGDNLEIEGASSGSSNPVSKYVESLLEHSQSMLDFGTQITPLNAKYVVLFKATDYESYDFLRRQDDLELLYEGETIALFHNLSPTARAYTVNDVVYVNTLDDYLRTSSGQNPLQRLYVLGPGTPASGVPEEVSPLQPSVTRLGPVAYRIEGVEGRFLVFTLPQHTTRDGWEYLGGPGLLNLDMMPAWRAAPGGGTILFSPFYQVYLPSYVLAILSLALMLMLLRNGGRR